MFVGTLPGSRSLGRIVQSIMPVSRDDKEVLVHTFVWLKHTRNYPNGSDPTFDIVVGFLPFLAVVYPVLIMPCEVGPHLTVYHIYAIEDPKDVGGVFCGGNL